MFYEKFINNNLNEVIFKKIIESFQIKRKKKCFQVYYVFFKRKFQLENSQNSCYVWKRWIRKFEILFGNDGVALNEIEERKAREY